MSQAIGAVLAFAVGVGISPIPIIAAIVVLFSARARVNGPVFLTGWVVGLTAVAAGAYLAVSALGLGDGPPSDGGLKWGRIALGVALLALAARKWRRRDRDGAEPELPAWLARVDGLGPGGAARLALLLSANPKNLLLALGAATGLVRLEPTTAQAVVALAAFVGIGAAAVAAAVLYQAVGGATAEARLEHWRGWLTLHNDAVVMVLLVVFGALLVSEGLGLRG